MSDSRIVTYHVRRFQVEGERSWLTAARQQHQADAQRAKVAANLRKEIERGTTTSKRSAAQTSATARATAGAVGDYKRLESAVVSLSRAQERALVREGALMERAAQARRKAAQEQRAMLTQQRRAAQVQQRAAVRPVVGPGLGAGLATGYGAGVLLRDAVQVQTALRDAGAAAQMSEKQQAALAKTSRRVGLEMAIGADSAAKLGGELAKAGVSSDALDKGALKAAATLKLAGDVADDVAGGAIARALGAFNMTGDQAGKVADMIAASSAATVDSVEGVSLALSQGAAASKELNVGLEQTILGFTLMAKRGTLGSDAGTAWKNAMFQLVKPTVESEEAQRRLGIELFNNRGELKSLVEIHDELTGALGRYEPQQRAATLKTIAGGDGFRALSAIMGTSRKEILATERALTQQGFAADVAQRKNEGLEGSMRKLRAARMELAVQSTEALLPGLEAGSDALTRALKRPETARAFSQLGRMVGGEIEQLARALDDAAQNGDLEKTLDAIAVSAGTVAQVGGLVVDVVGATGRVFAALPGPVRDAAAALVVYTIAARKAQALGGMLPFGGGAGGGGVGGGVGRSAPGGGGVFGQSVAAARSVASQRRTLIEQERAAVERLTKAQIAQTGALRAQSAAELAQYRNTGAGRRNPLLVATETRNAQAAARLANAQAATAQRNMMAAQAAVVGGPGRLAGVGAALRPVAMASRAGAGGAAAGGVTGALLAKDFLSAVVSGGAAGGVVGGPWGAAGGAVASAAAYGIKTALATKSRRESEEFGRQVSDAIVKHAGKDLPPEVQQQLKDSLAQARRDSQARDRQPRSNLSGGPQMATPAQIDAAVRSQANFGRQLGSAGVANARGKQFVSVSSLARDLFSRTNVPGAEPAAKQAAARTYLAYVRELEKGGKLAKGATDRFRRIVGQKINIDKQATVRTQLRVDLRKDAGDVAKELRQKLKGNAKLSLDITVPTRADLDIEKVGEAAKRQKRELDKIASGRTGANKKEREAAKKAADELDKLTDKFDDATKAARERAEAYAQRLQKEADQLKAVNDELQRRSDIIRAMPALPALSEMGPDQPAGNRRGGRISRFQAGGEVVAVSSQEAMRYPDGSWATVPGARTASDNVLTWAPYGTEVFTEHGQQLLAAGASRSQALRAQLPHFASGGTIGPARTAAAARRAGLSGSQLVLATAIAGAESGYRPAATNRNTDGSIDRGVWQINSVHRKYNANRLFDVGYNARAMAEISSGGSNWSPWVTYKTGAYRRYMAGARDAVVRSRSDSGSEFGDATVKVPLVLGRSRSGRGALVEDAFAQGLATGQSGYSGEDMRRFGSPFLRTVGEALGSGRYFRETTARGGGGGSAGSSSSGGVTTYGGKRVASWIVPALKYARKHGWSGSVTSGYRSYAEQQRLYANRGSNPNPVAKPGTSNHEGSQYPRGAVDVTDPSGLRSALKGYRGRKLKWYGPRDPVHFSATGHRRGGVIRGFAAGGKVGAVGGVSVDRGLSTGGPSFYRSLALAADEAAYRRVESTISRLRKVATGGGDARVVARARAAMAVLENALGVRVGRLMARATDAVSARQQNMQATLQVQRIRGIDPGSVRGIGGQMLVEQRFLADAPNRERDLKLAVARAQRGDLRTQIGRDKLNEAQAALNAFKDEVLDSRANLAELTRAQQEAAQAAREAATANMASAAALTANTADDAAAKRQEAADARARAKAAFERGDVNSQMQYDLQAQAADQEAARLARRNGLAELDAQLAVADLTQSNTDNLAILAQKEQAVSAALASAQAAGDTQDITELASLLKGIRDEIAAGNAEQQQSLEQQLEITRGQLEAANAALRVADREGVQGLLAAAMSQFIGSNIRAGSSYPAGFGSAGFGRS